ncbi:MAG TPA: phage tail assembly protein T [Buttiauxella sp.]|jgi:phage tail assembly protein T
MKLAREFSRPDWRVMLSELSSTELKDWAEFFGENFFFYSQIDAHFSSLEHLVLSMHCPKHKLSVENFSLLKRPAVAASNDDMTDEQIMTASEGLSGGMRFGPE